MAAEVLYPSAHRSHRRKEGVRRVTMSDGLVFFPILLRGEIEEDTSGGSQRSVRDSDAVGCCLIAKGERGVAEPKRMMVLAVPSVLPRAKHVKEADDQGIDHSGLKWIGKVRMMGHMSDELEGNWFYPLRGWVFIGPSLL